MSNSNKIEFIHIGGSDYDTIPQVHGVTERFHNNKQRLSVSLQGNGGLNAIDNPAGTKFYDNEPTPVLMTTMGYHAALYSGAIGIDSVLDKLCEPLSVDDSLDSVDDNDKLYFLESVDFPRRKLSILASTHGKVKNVSTVRKITNATKIIGNKTKLLKEMESYRNVSNRGSYNNILLLKTKYNPNNQWDTVIDNSCKRDRIFVIRIDSSIAIALKKSNGLYIENKYLTSDFPKLYKTLLNAINNVTDSHSAQKFSFYGGTPMENLDSIQIIYDIDSVEYMQHICSLGTTDIDEGYLNIVNQGLKIIDVSKIYKAIGNKTMEFDEYQDLHGILVDAARTGNTNILKMGFESLSSFDVDKSLLYLSLIFRDVFATRMVNNSVMNTNISSLYQYCNSIAQFTGYRADIKTLITNITSKGHSVEVPLSLLIHESKVEDIVKNTKNTIENDYRINEMFNVDVTVGINIHPKAASTVIMDVDLNEFVNKLNSVST